MKYIETTSSRGKNKTVEQQLTDITKKLAGTEMNIKLFSQMIRTGIGTNDAYNHAKKQSMLKKSSRQFDAKLLKTNMRMKLNDACAYAHRLRQARVRLIVKLF